MQGKLWDKYLKHGTGSGKNQLTFEEKAFLKDYKPEQTQERIQMRKELIEKSLDGKLKFQHVTPSGQSYKPSEEGVMGCVDENDKVIGHMTNAEMKELFAEIKPLEEKRAEEIRLEYNRKVQEEERKLENERPEEQDVAAITNVLRKNPTNLKPGWNSIIMPGIEGSGKVRSFDVLMNEDGTFQGTMYKGQIRQRKDGDLELKDLKMPGFFKKWFG